MRNITKLFGLAAIAAASALPMKGTAEPIVDVSFAQAGANSEAYFNVTNPDATYDSGSFKFEDALMPVAQAVKDNNVDYVNSSLDEIMDEWNISIQPNEVYGGWSATRNGSNLDLTNNGGFPGFDYTEWLKTSDNSAQDEFDFSVNFGGQLDFDGNGNYAGIEQLAKLDSKLLEGFTGKLDELNTYSTDINQVGVVPEPATIAMLGLGGLITSIVRRIKNNYGHY